jgi:glycosyltransferase involved in cell wall biosynthesis
MYPTDERPAFGVFVREQVESLRQAGLTVDVFVFEGKRGARSYLAAARILRDQLRQSRQRPYDLIHAHYGLTGAVARMQFGCPVVVTYHGSDLLGGVGLDHRYTLRGAVGVIISNVVGMLVDQCIVVADNQRKALGLSSAVKIPMGVNLDLFRPIPRGEARTQLGLDLDGRLVLFVAHPHSPTKRYDIAKSAVRLLQNEDPHLQLLPVYNLPHDQIPVYMNAANALILTSMHEGSPCVIKEALACNLPIVSVDVGDVAERLNGVTGCYLCERTPDDVAAKLRCVFGEHRPTNGREKIQNLSLQKVAQEVIAVYRDVLRYG